LETVMEQTKAAAEARDFDEYKRLRSTPQPAEPKAENSPSEGVTSDSGPDKGETAPASEPGNKSQERTERPSEKRIRQLNEKLKESDERYARLERDLEEMRKGIRNPETAKPADVLKPGPKAEAKAEEGEPDFEALLDAAIDDPANTTYEKAQAAALRAYHKAIREAEGKRAERERAESQAKTAHETRLAKTRERHGDFDEVVASAIPQVEGVHNPGIEAAMEASDSAEVVYYFATHLEEFRRIAQMKPQAAYRATVALDLKLAQSTPEKTASAPRQASRAPAPITPVTGATAHTPKSPAEARDYAEYKRLRGARN
jgi:hypothetical protein